MAEPTEPHFSITDTPTAAEQKQKPAVQKAVALSYDRNDDNAPRVVASGKGALAEQILQVAFDRGIKVREDAELVEILSLVEVDSAIPLEAGGAAASALSLSCPVGAGASSWAVVMCCPCWRPGLVRPRAPE